MKKLRKLVLYIACVVMLCSCNKNEPETGNTAFCYNYDKSLLSSFTRVYNGYYIRTDDGVDIVYSDIWPNVLEIVGSTSDLDFSDCAVGDYIRVDVYDINSENGSGKVILNKYTPCEAENNQNGAENISNIKAYLHLLGYKMEPDIESTVIWGDTSITITPDSGCEYVLYAAPSNVNCCTAAVISKGSRTVTLKQRSIREGAEYSEISHNDLAYWYTGCDNNSTESILIEGELSEMIEANDEVSDIFIYNCKFKEYTTGTNITDNYIQEGTLVAFGYEECDSMYCMFFEEAHWTIEEIKDLIGIIKVQPVQIISKADFNPALYREGIEYVINEDEMTEWSKDKIDFFCNISAKSIKPIDVIVDEKRCWGVMHDEFVIFYSGIKVEDGNSFYEYQIITEDGDADILMENYIDKTSPISLRYINDDSVGDIQWHYYESGTNGAVNTFFFYDYKNLAEIKYVANPEVIKADFSEQYDAYDHVFFHADYLLYDSQNKLIDRVYLYNDQYNVIASGKYWVKYNSEIGMLEPYKLLEKDVYADSDTSVSEKGESSNETLASFDAFKEGKEKIPYFNMTDVQVENGYEVNYEYSDDKHYVLLSYSLDEGQIQIDDSVVLFDSVRYISTPTEHNIVFADLNGDMIDDVLIHIVLWRNSLDVAYLSSGNGYMEVNLSYKLSEDTENSDTMIYEASLYDGFQIDFSCEMFGIDTHFELPQKSVDYFIELGEAIRTPYFDEKGNVTDAGKKCKILAAADAGASLFAEGDNYYIAFERHFIPGTGTWLGICITIPYRFIDGEFCPQYIYFDEKDLQLW